MPKTTKSGQPKKDELPSTLQRSDAKAQRTFTKAHDSAAETYGEGERAHRTAYAAVKHTHEKVGDHWEPKDEKGPSDPQAAQSGKAARDAPKETYGGIDVKGNTKAELYERSKKAGIPNRSSMSQHELATALQRREG